MQFDAWLFCLKLLSLITITREQDPYAFEGWNLRRKSIEYSRIKLMTGVEMPLSFFVECGIITIKAFYEID